MNYCRNPLSLGVALLLGLSVLAQTTPANARLITNSQYPFNFMIPNDMNSKPRVYGTQYDCKIRVAEDGRDNVYQAFVNGRFNNPNRAISSVACFQSMQMCQRYLNFMRGYLDFTQSAACQRGYANIFDWFRGRD